MFGFPLLLIPLAILNIIVFLMPGVVLTAPVFSVALFSGAIWGVTIADILLATSLLLLLCEIAKLARAGGRFVTDHLLSLLVFCVVASEFLLLDAFAHSFVFLLCGLCFVDFVAGVMLHAKRSERKSDAVTAPPQAAPLEAAPVPTPLPVQDIVIADVTVPAMAETPPEPEAKVSDTPPSELGRGS